MDFFPKIKCVARGNTIKLIGLDESIEVFEHKFSLMLEHFSKYQSLTHSNIERIMYEDNAILQGNNNILVHGPNGKIIKAKTVNQRNMVNESQNDMLFVAGPAGTGKHIQQLLLLLEL